MFGRKVVLFSFFMAAAQFLSAADYYVSSGETKIGEWNSNVLQTIKKGEEDHIPIVMVGTAFGCSICANFKATILPNEKLKAWVANSPYYFLHAYSGSGWWTTPELKAFIDIVGNGGLPRIGGYWKKKDGTIVGGQRVTFVGSGLGVDYYINFWDRLFKDYDPNVNDQWDPADDTQEGATDLGAPAATATVTELHYMNAAAEKADTNDWFKLSLTGGTRYALYQDLSTYENVAPKVEVLDSKGNVLQTLSTDKEMFIESPCVFTAAETGTYYVRFYYEGAAGKASYKLAYREFEEVSFGFKSAEVTVRENATNAVLTLTRSGRLTDAVDAHVSTSNQTALAGTDYTALKDVVVSFAVNATEATVSVPIIDIPGSQGNKQFAVVCVNPEDTGAVAVGTVKIEDLDVPVDAKDPADDEVAGATAFDITDETQTVKTLEGAGRVVSGSDSVDWYVFNALEKGKTYQVKVPAGSYGKRPESAPSDPEVTFYLGSAENPMGGAQKLSDLEKAPLRFVAEEDGPLYVQVANKAGDSTVYTYDLAWQEWVLPIVSFTNATGVVASAAQGDKTETITLKREKNLEEEISVRVEVEGNTARVQTGTNTVIFAAGSDTATLPLRLLPDGGMWSTNEIVTVTVLDDAAVHQDAETAIHGQTLTLKTALAEFDADDGEKNTNSNAANATVIPVGKRPTTRADLTLNGSDKIDWYAFDVEEGVEYVFELVDLQPETDEPLPLQVEVMLPGESVGKQIALADCHGQPCHFTAAAAGKVALGVTKTAEEPASIKYALKYREWVPATISLATNAIEVSEFASSVRIPVQCDMEVSLPVTVDVKTRDGTAKAGEDYMALSTTLAWDERSPASSIKYATVNLKKLIAEYEGAYEEFEVYLDFADSEGIAGECTNLTVRILESDVGAVGTFAIAGYSLDGGETVNPYQTRQIPVTAGDQVLVKVVRTGGNAGDVGLTLTWTDGTKLNGKMADLETETWIEATVPESEGQYVARQVRSMTLATDVKNAKTKNATLTFSITDGDTTLQAYAADRTKLPVTSTGNAWYVGADGLVRTRSATKANEMLTMSTTLKGPGTLSFKKIQSGEGVIAVTAGRTPLELVEEEGVVTAKVPAGTQRITVTFTAAAAGAFLMIDEFAFTPDESVFYVGTFYGDVVLNSQQRGLATLTAASSGRVSGKFTMPSNQIWTVTGKLVDGAADDAIVRRAKVVLTDSSITVANQGELDAQAGAGTETEFDVLGARNGWSDRPLMGIYAESAGLLGQTLEYADEMGELTFKVGVNGSTRVVGTYNGKHLSASVVPFARDGQLWAVLVNSILPNGMLFKFVCTEDVWTVTKGE